MNAITKVLAPAALALFAIGAQASSITGGETYNGQAITEAASQSSVMSMSTGVDTGGETYSGFTNTSTIVGGSTQNAELSDRGLDHLYLG